MRIIPWFKVDDAFHSHPKVMELTTGAVGLWTLAGAWCADYLTDGEIRTGQLRRLGGTEDEAAQLVEAGLWIPTEDGYRFRDWHDYQPTRESVEAERDASRERQRKRREAREKQRRDRQSVTASSQRDTGVSHATVTEEFVTPVPEPVPEVPKGTNSPSSHVVNDDDGRSANPAEGFPEHVIELCDHLADHIRRNGNRVGKVGATWWQAMDRLIRLDDYTPDQVRQVIDWSQQDEFWQGNILSAKKLREKFDQLKTRMFAERNKATSPQQFQTASERRYAQGMSLVEDELREFYSQPQEIEQ